jgi:hypothetical protein
MSLVVGLMLLMAIMIRLVGVGGCMLTFLVSSAITLPLIILARVLGMALGALLMPVIILFAMGLAGLGR